MSKFIYFNNMSLDEAIDSLKSWNFDENPFRSEDTDIIICTSKAREQLTNWLETLKKYINKDLDSK